MKKTIFLASFLILLSANASEDCAICVGSRNMELQKIKDPAINDITAYFGYENVDWTIDDAYQGQKIILKLHTPLGSTYETKEDSAGYKTRYVVGNIDLTTSAGEKGLEYSYLKFSAITKEEALKLHKGDGIKIVSKVVDYGQFNLKKDLPIGEKIFASFEPVHYKMAVGIKPTEKTQIELNGESGIGYSFAKSTDPDYQDVSNFYVGLKAGLKVKHDTFGTFGFDYGVDSGVLVQNIRPGSPQDLSREGRVRATYGFKVAKNVNCESYIEKRSFQLNPGFDETTGTKQDRLYEKAKTVGFGCNGRF